MICDPNTSSGVTFNTMVYYCCKVLMPSTVLGWLISNIEPRPTSVKVNYSVHSFISGRYKQITLSRYAQHMKYMYLVLWKMYNNSKKGQLDMFCYEQ